MITGSTAIFAVKDIESTIAYYKDVLGFTSSWTWGDPPSFGCVSMGNTSIMFNQQPDLATKIEGHQHWFKVDDVDELYKLHTERGAQIVSPIDNMPWDVREYVVRDPHGYRLRFAGTPSQSAAPSSPFPADVQIVRRKPTEQEYREVGGRAFDNPNMNPEALDQTWLGVVAQTPNGDAIAMLRIMKDSSDWFSIWDVAVLPDWQGRRIGSAIMKEALQVIREESPGAMVHLFTFKHAFYEKLGFAKETVCMLKV